MLTSNVFMGGGGAIFTFTVANWIKAIYLIPHLQPR